MYRYLELFIEHHFVVLISCMYFSFAYCFMYILSTKDILECVVFEYMCLVNLNFALLVCVLILCNLDDIPYLMCELVSYSNAQLELCNRCTIA